MNAMTRRAVFTRAILLFVLTAIGAAQAVDAHAEDVALITDLQGKSTFAASGGELSILARIADQSQIELAPASRMVALWLSSGEEYSFVGPAAIRIAASGPQMLSGAQPTRRPSALKNGVRFDPSRVAQTVFIMRGAKNPRIRLLTLAGTRTLDPAPEFRWRPIPGVLQYRFELADTTGRALLEVDVTGEGYRLPAAVKLEEGANYTWELSTRLPDGRKYAAAGDFSIVPAALRERVESVRPSAGASLAERVAFAVWLEEQELRDEARKYWKDAATERPGEGTLRQLARE